MKWWHFRIRFVVLLFFTHLILGSESPLSDPFGFQREETRLWYIRSQSSQLVAAITSYRADYGRYPWITEDGFCETKESNAFLIRTLTESDPKENPRQIRYLDIPIKTAIPPKIVRNGINRETGVWVDPWGNFYRIRIPTNSPRILNPYSEDGPTYLDVTCLVWSVGKDGVQGNRRNSLTRRRSDDIVSWQK